MQRIFQGCNQSHNELEICLEVKHTKPVGYHHWQKQYILAVSLLVDVGIRKEPTRCLLLSSFKFPQLREPETIEYICVWVNGFITVHKVCCYCNECIGRVIVPSDKARGQRHQWFNDTKYVAHRSASRQQYHQVKNKIGEKRTARDLCFIVGTSK